mmetsp:Transcript_2203/g.8083  ORF Transcript_2203/g.8083 Transcript_2203/m.8083 type:complete len:422 (-) Transcript_2203:3085-4350(-)
MRPTSSTQKPVHLRFVRAAQKPVASRSSSLTTHSGSQRTPLHLFSLQHTPIFTPKWSRITALLIITTSVLISSPFILAYALSNAAIKPNFYNQMASNPKHGLRSPADFAHDQVMSDYFKTLLIENTDPRQVFGLEFEEVEFPSDEHDNSLRGWFIPSSRCFRESATNVTHQTVILSHGAFVDRRAVLKHVKYLNAKGYHTFLYDMRDHGISDSSAHRGTSLGIREHRDVIRAIDYIHQRFHNRTEVALFGTSNGGTSSICGGAIDPRVKAIIAENPFSDRKRQVIEAVESAVRKGDWGGERLEDVYGGRFMKYLTELVPDSFFLLIAEMVELRLNGIFNRVPQPVDFMRRIDEAGKKVLLLHSMKDVMVAPHHSMDISAACKNCQLKLFKKGAHSRIVESEKENYRRTVLSFLDEHFPLKC